MFGTQMTRIERMTADNIFILSVIIRCIRVIRVLIFICENLSLEFWLLSEIEQQSDFDIGGF